MNTSFTLNAEVEKCLAQIMNKKMTSNTSQVLREAIIHYWNFLFDKNGVYIHQNKEAIALMELAADLPGMSLAVIQSHLVRFPKVTPEIYRRILERLNAQHAEGTLKNPEAAAYGMCKLAQNGKLPDFLKPEPQATATPTEAAPVPQAALMPFAK